MHRISIPASIALVAAIIAISGATVIIAHSSRQPGVAQASTSIDVMQMMRNAKDLPEQQYDAH
jgi:hypothetical protein